MAQKLSHKPCDLVLFGTKGDLARRKLIPSLYQLEVAGLLAADTRITGVARNEMTTEEYIELVTTSLERFVKEGVDEEAKTRFVARLNYCQIDMKSPEQYKALCEVVDLENRTMVNYFSTPPSIFGDICSGLNAAGLVVDDTRVVVEKPIGHCLESSKVINDKIAEYFKESQIYRIDHYLGKETVLNLLVLRFANAIFTNNWDHECIDHVQITVAEVVGVEGRWGYYDDAGQMRDMVQNHLLQILSLLAMEPPVDISADSIRDEKLKVLRALRPIDSNNYQEKTVRGQYTSGFVEGKSAPGYLEEEGANTQSTTETFASIRVDIDNWRWAGVPFYLRTGKRMASKGTEIVVHFKDLPHNIFKDTYKSLPANKLLIRLQPDEGVEIHLLNKVPGLGETMELQNTKLDLSFSDTFKNERIADAYERLILEAMLGNQSLFVRRDEVEAAWSWVDGILDAWKGSNEPPRPYAAGSWGPVASIAMLARDEREWDE
ncbi:glucose-6-phosphate dehydrogenase [Psychrosphaera sp. B3R10]|uniref:Glucose-6-phosphate 1-dehydrogenase n=1 Tax=Psychrosphaera algicola TaxID=3023714 RepID=A0ABT5F8N8_9GAMM|nr:MULTISPECIES: glucose-6-phosphate dehydrogenase [unclassified Psychrosphaera]MBU2882178.1 glucose-6-phosphate dehydrogenase [Psychrosphaera sp. I2R16]MBU2988859.1 glucose-6-phosphate dehydrogenase [Psychrosphaera sp. B3R10]MDC2887786.1 glucose-6-phosphate dehydrogenase [Psychrosphaera sp. G1-22]MDO6717878.1 glucose-6-phosphate dehydrogenase [Psychrosphaera sp. 1_MG-2023]